MSLIVRRAAAAKGLLAAGAAVMFIAVLLLAGLTAYAGASGEAGIRAAVAAAAPADRSVLIRGAGGADLSEHDRAVRAAYAGGLGGAPVTVDSAVYGSGWAVDRPGAGATADSNGVVYGNVMALDNLPAHATLVSGDWPSGPRAAALAEPAARLLGVETGGTLRLVDRRTSRIVPILVSGIWRARDAGDAYWRLTPDVFAGRAPQTATHGPIVVDRKSFDSGFATGASAGWVVVPDMSGTTLEEVSRTASSATVISDGLPASTGLSTSATITSGLPGLAQRLDRADLVRRSALVTPILLLAVLAGYALTLVALLLGEARRAETALLRARGASRGRLGAMAGIEALALMLPAGLLAPPLAVLLVRTVPFPGGPAVTPVLDASVWLTGALAVAGGVLALTIPALRRARTYVAETASRSRLPLFRRAGLDLVVVALAVLGWVQLRQYSSPVGAGLGIDPLLAAAPTLGVLTGAVVAIRLLPPIARLAASRLDRGVTRARLLGTWQAGRRSHAGPMVMLALAVAAATVSWCFAGTARGSLDDQAEQQVGAEMRLVEEGGTAPGDRLEQLSALPGAGTIVPGWRDTVPLTAGADPADLVVIDAAKAGPVVLARDDATGGSPAELFRRLAGARQDDGAERELRPGRIVTSGPARTTVIFTDGRRVDLGQSDRGRPLSFSEAGPGLAGFVVDPGVAGPGPAEITWQITGQDGRWQAAGRSGEIRISTDDGTLSYTGRFAVTRPATRAPVPVAMTPAALTALTAKVGENSFLTVAGRGVPIHVVAVIDRVPGTSGGAAILADRAVLDARLFEGWGIVQSPGEWWLSGAPPGVHDLPGLRVLDRRELAGAASRDPVGSGSRVALFLAAFGAVLLAAAGIAADARATARRRAGELAVLHTLGAGPRLLARSLVVEQAFLAGVGSLAGLTVGLLVAGAMAPLLVLTPAAVRPVPEPVLQIGWLPTLGSVALLVSIALALSAATATSAARRLPATRLRLGADQ
ncbi:FtsX-like permease family protein [Actinoplanes sp. GCM10030250]|uniref:FtsX-like permease family protein n=1 Tax=Actinoplanes sp. GCM10030250 TaxID=3273376 RepID=UPI00360E3FC2